MGTVDVYGSVIVGSDTLGLEWVDNMVCSTCHGTSFAYYLDSFAPCGACSGTGFYTGWVTIQNAKSGE